MTETEVSTEAVEAEEENEATLTEALAAIPVHPPPPVGNTVLTCSGREHCHGSEDN